MADESKGDGCCPAGSHPELILDEEATLAGKVVTLPSGLVTYQVPAADPECKKAIIVIYDVHGFSGGRIKGVNDSLAKSTGLHVIMPDLYGDSVGINDKGGFSSPDGKAWLKTYDWPRLEKSLKQVEAEYLAPKGITAVAAVGFCWGAYVVFKMSAAGMIKVGGACHPSLGIGPLLFGESVASQAEAVKCPIVLCPAGNDPADVKEGGLVEAELKKRGVDIKIRAFPEMRHGWVPRGDAKDAAIARGVQEALQEVSAFLTANL